MADTELNKVVQSVWDYERKGINFVGSPRPHMVLTHDLYDRLRDHVDALSLFLRLQRFNWHRDKFFLANAMAKAMGWDVRKFKAARTTLVRQEVIACLDEGGTRGHNPPVYAWVGRRR
jgi:hypothetical protein